MKFAILAVSVLLYLDHSIGALPPVLRCHQSWKTDIEEAVVVVIDFMVFLSLLSLASLVGKHWRLQGGGG